MLIANNEFEQTLKLPAHTLTSLKLLAAGKAPQTPIAEDTAEALITAGLLKSPSELTPEGKDIIRITQNPLQQLSISQLHSPEENKITVYTGLDQCIVWARLINAQGQASEHSLFSRTTPENALQHLLLWLNLPLVDLPDQTATSIPLSQLTPENYSPNTRGWFITSTTLPGPLNIFLYKGYLWRMRQATPTHQPATVLEVEAEDTLTFALLLHQLWATSYQD